MRILLPLPGHDFDPTETAVPYTVLREAGHEVVFATPDGTPGVVDDRMVTGRGLFIWRWLLRAHPEPRRLFAEMTADRAYAQPMSWSDIDPDAFDGVILPGGHAPGMRPYLESEALQHAVGAFIAAERPVGAICHGTVLAARSLDPRTGRSVLDGRRTTGLPKSMELSAWLLTALWLGRYYRTYDQTVQAEVAAAAGAFDEGPFALLRDTRDTPERGFVVRDGCYLSARWPGDAWRFSYVFRDMLDEADPRPERQPDEVEAASA